MSGVPPTAPGSPESFTGLPVGQTAGYAMRGRQGRVINGLGQAIVGGRYQPGELLPKEAELIQEYGVSRTSVREAMKVLAAKGLVEIRQKVGTRVRPKDLWNSFDSDLLAWHYSHGGGADTMRDLVELRQILEPAAARLAAGRATMTDLNRLEHAEAAMRLRAQEDAGYAVSDVEFHLAVYAASHNDLLQQFGQLVADFMRLSFEVQQQSRGDRPADFSADAERHREVYDAINRGDGTQAFESMLRVVLDGKSALIEALALADGTFSSGEGLGPTKRG